MTIEKKLNGTEMTMAVEGRLDTITAPELEAALRDPANPYDSIVLDFAKLDYISSAGLRVLLGEEKLMSGKGGMIIRNVNDAVMEVFNMTNFSEILKIE
ncbi:MAG: STAS domain-containing protein [Lachnospiraceae bacterium]|jgi:anti-sigma B factor antagonist|nr:STAS domain-containing protein [Lachnospiraceae bacterium]MCI1727154.1 STAS domain-containing protein [Lachnospiraceae bacterium]